MMMNLSDKRLKRFQLVNQQLQFPESWAVAEGVLHNWKKAKLEKSSSAEQEVLELKKRLKEVEMENAILKKAALIFGRGS